MNPGCRASVETGDDKNKPFHRLLPCFLLKPDRPDLGGDRRVLNVKLYWHFLPCKLHNEQDIQLLVFMDYQERNFWNLFIFSWLSILKHFVQTELKVLNLNNFDDFWFCVILFFRSPKSNIFEHVLTSMSSERKGNIDLNTGLVLDYTLGFWTFC